MNAIERFFSIAGSVAVSVTLVYGVANLFQPDIEDSAVGIEQPMLSHNWAGERTQNRSAFMKADATPQSLR